MTLEGHRRSAQWAQADGAVVECQFAGDPRQAYYLCLPSGLRADAPVLVCVHGISRNAEEHIRYFAPLAQQRGVVVVAPLFPRAEFPDYQRLGRAGRGRRADLALHDILAEVHRRASVAVDKVYLFGHSGGAQFVHRYVMANPAGVAGFVISAAGWYTHPAPDLPFPFGIGPDPLLPDLHFDPDAFLRVPGCVLVGERDTRRGRSLRTAAPIDAAQGRTRLERAGRWAEAMNRAAVQRRLPPPLDLHVLPRSGHRFAEVATRGGAPGRVFDCLFGPAAVGAA
ncbi:MAG TPA: hypothetical protein VNE67_04315 [Acetobacteraceae bacterium]|nr:hypothetical protein [Acetobacteraceae bacterium]